MSVDVLRCETPNRPFIVGQNYDWRMAIFFRPRCKMWRCPACAEINGRLWAMRTHHGVEQYMNGGTGVNFVTLTCHEKLSQSGALKVWPSAWKKLHTRANRAAGHGAYMMVPEQHKSGKMHMHLLTTWAMPESWWKDNGRECGLGYMAKVKPVENAGIGAWYVTKYLKKQMHLNEWPARFRHVRASQDWPKLPERERDLGWEFGTLPNNLQMDHEIQEFQEMGWKVVVADHLDAWEIVDAFNNHGVVE